MTTSPLSLHLTSATLERLAERQRETGQTAEQLAEQLIEEGLRMQRHTGIYFQDGPSGRRPKVLGGPDVWELVAEIEGLQPDDDTEIEDVAARMCMAPSRVRSAIRYYLEFRNEIDAWVDRNNREAEKHERQWRAARGLPPR